MKNVNNQYIILAAGKINYLNLPINTNSSNSMIPINGKPVISWILEDLKKRGEAKISIVTRRDDKHLNDFLFRSYFNHTDIRVIEMEKTESIVETLFHGLQFTNRDLPLTILLGDTLITDSYNETSDFVFVHKVNESRRWCLAQFNTNLIIENFAEKQQHVSGDLFAVCGYYFIRDSSTLTTCCEESIRNNEKQISEVLVRYKIKYPLKAVQASVWYDFGNIDNLIKAKQQLLQSRYFNSLQIDPLLNTITKVSEFDEKLRNELNWYEELPEKLKVLTPRIISKDEHDGKLHMVQEYYGYPNLAELYLYSDLNADNWKSIMNKLMMIHEELCRYKGESTPDQFHDIYYQKTIDRLNSLKIDEYWATILSRETVVINKKLCKNIFTFESILLQKCSELEKSGACSIIHGDFCLSNILFDINSQITKLIDPRGSFGRRGIYGDPRYDIAKLRHSFAGFYDFIVSDLFFVEEDQNEFRYQIYTNDNSEEISHMFDTMIIDAGYNLNEIKFIEALLFISMLPLHKDKPNRQKIMYLQGIQLLNEIFNETSN